MLAHSSLFRTSRTFRSKRCLWLLASAVLSAVPSGAMPQVVRDSVGVRIVENSAPVWTGDQSWTISAEPVLELGMGTGRQEYEFYRVAGARRLQDGRIVVADGGSRQLRFFDGAGRFLSSAGRQGGGPGEFSWIERLWVYRDTLVVWDIALNRVSLFDLQGQYVRSLRIHGLPPELFGQFADGTYVGVVGVPAATPTDASRLRRDTLACQRYDTAGEFLNRVTLIAAEIRYRFSDGGITAHPQVPFYPSASYSVHGMTLIAGSGDISEIEVRFADGRLDVLVRWPTAERRVTSDLLSRYNETVSTHARDESWEKYYRAFFRAAPAPGTLPVFDAIVVDDEGNIWVRRYEPPWELDRRWIVFDRRGRWLGSVEIPSGLRIIQIGPDFVLGVYRDDLDIERVRLHMLRKSTQP